MSINKDDRMKSLLSFDEFDILDRIGGFDGLGDNVNLCELDDCGSFDALHCVDGFEVLDDLGDDGRFGSEEGKRGWGKGRGVGKSGKQGKKGNLEETSKVGRREGKGKHGGSRKRGGS